MLYVRWFEYEPWGFFDMPHGGGNRRRLGFGGLWDVTRLLVCVPLVVCLT